MSLLHPLGRRLRRAFHDEDGAVTVDWVVLTALVVGLAAAMMLVLQDPVNNGAQNIADLIE